MSFTNVKISIIFLMLYILSVCSLAVAAPKKNTVTGDFYTVTWTAVSQQGKRHLEITALPVGNVHCNLEYPWKLTVVSDDGIHFFKTALTGAEAGVFSDSRVAFALPYDKPAKKAAATLELKLSMCDDRQCFIKKVPIEVALP